MRATAFIGRVTDVTPHPDNAELRSRLDVVTIVVPHGNGQAETSPSQYINCANREDGDKPRYKVGDYAVVLAENTILPDWLIKRLDMWNYEKNKGGLGGSKGNRLKSRAMGVNTKIVSEVALLPVEWTRLEDLPDADRVCNRGIIFVSTETGETVFEVTRSQDGVRSVRAATVDAGMKPVEIDDDFTPTAIDIAEFLGITEVYVP